MLGGTKWAANLWVWNGPRFGAHEPRVAGAEQPAPQPDARARQASFRNEDVAAPRRVELYYEETHFATLQPGAVAMAVRARARARGGRAARRRGGSRSRALPLSLRR